MFLEWPIFHYCVICLLGRPVLLVYTCINYIKVLCLRGQA